MPGHYFICYGYVMLLEAFLILLIMSNIKDVGYCSMDCRMYSLNVKGIRERDKRERIFSWCKDKGADIVFLQETFSTRDVEDRWSSMWEGSCYFSHGSNHSKGVLVLISPRVDIEVLEVFQDNEGRYIFIDCKIQGIRLVLGNVYF